MEGAKEKHSGPNLAERPLFDLNDANFGDHVTPSSGYWLIQFCVPWVSACKRLERPWNALAAKLFAIGTETRVGFVDASLASGAALADKFGVVQKELPAVYVLYFFGSCSRAAAKDSPTPMVRTQLPPLE